MTDASFSNVTIQRNTAGVGEDLLTLDSVDGADGNGSGLRFINNSSGALSLAIARVSALRVDASTVRLDLGVAADSTVSSGDATPALLSLVKGPGAPRITTAAGSALSVGGTLTVSGATTLAGTLGVTGATTLAGGLSVTGPISASSTVDGRDISADGAALDQHIANSTNPHATTAAQVGALSLTGGTLTGALAVQGAIYAGGSDLYFTETGHVHSGIGNTAGYAAIENASDYGALMILGRSGTPQGRAVKLWDYLQVNGPLDVTGAISARGSDLYFTETTHIHTGIGNTAGCAAIENASDYGALMILGRSGTPQGRAVKLWDYLQVNGPLDVTGNLSFGTQTRQMINLWGVPNYGIGVQSWTQYFRSDANFAWYVGGGHHDDQLNSGGGRVSMTLRNGALHVSGNVGIANYRPEHMPGWSGGGLICWDVLYAGGLHKHSTIRVKEHIEPISDALTLIGRLNPVRYDRRDAADGGQNCLGFIAEEVREVAPECASPDDDFFAWGVNESSFHALAVAGIQELSRRLRRLEQRQRRRRRPAARHESRPAIAPITVLRERPDPASPDERYTTVRFQAQHPTYGHIETVRTLRLPAGTAPEALLDAARERWLSTLETPTSYS